VRGGRLRVQHFLQFPRTGSAAISRRVLLQDVLSYGEEIRLRRADRLDIRHPQQAQVNLLSNVRDIGNVVRTRAEAKKNARS